jgi:hypothetical protein
VGIRWKDEVVVVVVVINELLLVQTVQAALPNLRKVVLRAAHTNILLLVKDTGVTRPDAWTGLLSVAELLIPLLGRRQWVTSTGTVKIWPRSLHRCWISRRAAIWLWIVLA